MMGFDRRPSPIYCDEDPEESMAEASVAVLTDAMPTTDQEQGTDAAAIKTQGAAYDEAVRGHFNEFREQVDQAVTVEIAGIAGIGKVTRRPDVTERLCQLALSAIKLAWSQFGGAEVSAIIGVIKEQMMGDMQELEARAYETVRGAIERLGTEFSGDAITVTICNAVTDATDSLVVRATRALDAVPVEEKARQWRLMEGTVENITVRGEKLDADDRATERRVFLDETTGIPTSGLFADQLAVTMGQEALGELANDVDTPVERTALLKRMESGEVADSVHRAERALHYDRRMGEDADERARVLE